MMRKKQMWAKAFICILVYPEVSVDPEDPD